MSVVPLRDWLVVSVMKEEEKVGSGLIYKPATVEDKIVQGTVLSAGSGKLTANGQTVALEVKDGDVVVFNKHMATEVKHKGESFLLLREESVLCVLR